MKKFLILGSTYTTDVFSEADVSDKCTILAKYSKISLATIFSPKVSVSRMIERSPNSSGKRMVISDHKRKFLEDILSLDYDFVLMDLIDEKYNLLETESGGLITLSPTYLKFSQSPLPGKIIKFGSKKYFQLWLKGLDGLNRILTEQGRVRSLRINRVNLNCLLDQEFCSKDSKIQDTLSHDFFSAAYNEIQKKFGPDVFYEYSITAGSSIDENGDQAKIGLIEGCFEYKKTLIKYIQSEFTSIKEYLLPNIKEVTISVDHEKSIFSSEIFHEQANCPIEYAFYLMKDNGRLSKVWFQNENRASFLLPDEPGKYHIKGLIRRKGFLAFRSEKSMFISRIGYAPDAWGGGILNIPIEEGWTIDRPKSQMYRFLLSNDCSIDFLITNAEHITTGSNVLVCFSGAISSRKGKFAPFFSGGSLANSLNMACISVSDPTLAMSNSISLAWYAGHKGLENLPQKIAELLDGFMQKFGAKLILFGGSGGGFAVISVLRRLEGPACGIVWNPQTSIDKYHSKGAVREYLRTAFPDLDSRGPNIFSTEEVSKQLEIEYDLTSFTNFNNHNLVYLQNSSDIHHVEDHALRFFKISSFPVAKECLIKNSTLLFSGDWADGHIPPPRKMLQYIITSFAQDRTLLDIKSGLKENSLTVNRPEVEVLYIVELELIKNKALVKLLRPTPGSEFYICLYNNKKKIASGWSNEENFIEFSTESCSGLFKAITYIKKSDAEYIYYATSNSCLIISEHHNHILLSPKLTRSGLDLSITDINVINSASHHSGGGSIEFKPRHDLSAWHLTLPLNWSIDPFEDMNWRAQLNMWRGLDCLLLEFHTKKAKTSLFQFLKWVEDWHRFHIKEGKNSTYAWADMAVGIRAMKLAYVIAQWQANRIEITNNQINILSELVSYHLSFLLKINNYKFNNHSVFDIQGLVALGHILDDRSRKVIFEFSKKIFNKIFGNQFGSNGVHLENSFEYHIFCLSLFRKIRNFQWFKSCISNDILINADRIASFLRLPDGRINPVGDTNGCRPRLTEKPVFNANNELLNESGYVIYRDDGEGDIARSTYFVFMCAYNNVAHKHCDCLSVTWFYGEDILVDAGKYAYKNDKYRNFVTSRRAHNTIDISPSEYRQIKNNAYGSAVELIIQYEWGCIVRATVTFNDGKVVQQRVCVVSNEGWLVTIDNIGTNDINEPSEYIHWSHFSPETQLCHQSTTGAKFRLSSGRSLCVVTTVHTLGEIFFEKGKGSEPLQGWISRGYGEIEENLAMGISKSGTRNNFLTLYSIDDFGSTIGIVDNNMVRVDIVNKQASRRFIINTSIEHFACIPI